MGRESYQLAAELVTASPVSSTTLVESNPFSLQISVGSTGGSGGILLQSAAPSTPPLIVQYWKLSYDQGNLSGQLGNTHAQEGLVLNYITASAPLVACEPNMGTLPPSPQGFGVGSTLSGTLTSGGADLVFQGVTTEMVGSAQYQVRFEFVA